MRRASAVALAAAGCVLSACGPSEAPPTIVVTSTEFVAPQPESVPSRTGAPEVPAATDAQSLADAAVQAASHLGTAGAAVGGPEGIVVAGFTEPTPAWSTIKVPIAIAALRADPSLSPDAAAAITASDNDAAQRLYTAAGEAGTNAVLAELGLGTGVNTAPLRPEFSTFGQTPLSVVDEATMANTLACVSGAGEVLGLMGQVDPGQSYGLGTQGALFKGGWGPDESGMYQVRQFGLLPRGDGTYVPVALTALPADGSYESGQRMLSAMAQTLGEQPDALTPAGCQP
ncbi:hypothetical protein MHJ95_10885 [Corynebacterium imitans]|uniref:hypothetical protein n=1 Tax=Corynebacterium imitans TaxID=156978 RepID=UPI001EF22987|nr:hypothetical protein [Corynebacterium imitans]MCG7279479.1 hypothetical protein [Corynebacterium imitans]